jgi:hypothetical protein
MIYLFESKLDMFTERIIFTNVSAISWAIKIWKKKCKRKRSKHDVWCLITYGEYNMKKQVHEQDKDIYKLCEICNETTSLKQKRKQLSSNVY